MKQEATKKNKLWIVLVACLAALLVVAGVVTALFLLPGEQEQTPAGPTEGRPELYWNIDRIAFTADSETGLSTREPGEDGLFHIRFAYNGEQVELNVADRQLINYIDILDVMGVVKDADGTVIDVVDPKTIATEKARDFFVKKVDGSTVTLNSSMAMNGMDMELELGELAAIYDVDPDAEVVGQIAELGVMDKVLVYTNALDQVTHVYITERAVEAGVYWRVEKKYDSEKACTTREPDENGVYTILCAHEGEQVELKCKDISIVNEIDAANNIYAEFAFVLDEEGYIVESVDVGLALKGVKSCNNYDVTEISGNTFSALRNLAGNELGNTYDATWDESCDIFLMENGCEAEFVGQRVDSLKVGDRITVYTDLEGKPILIFVINREVDSPMYYRLDKYGTKGGVTLRPKDANGYYVFEMACQGKIVKLRTKDSFIATRIEWRNPAMMGLKLDGDIILDYYTAGCVTGWGTAFNGYYVQSISAPIVTLVNAATGKTYNRMLAADAEVYDIAGNYGVQMGAITELKVGDKVVCGRNIADELTHVYITQRYEESAKLYYNMNRKYNTKEKVTNREPDENGYYVFQMLQGGKQVELKTKNKKLATWIDAQSTQMIALTVSGSTITNAFQHVTAFKYGYRPVNYNYVRAINWTERTFTTYYYDGDEVKENKGLWKLAENYTVYNVSTGYVSQRGEKTTLKKDDRIQTFATEDTGEIFLILVIDRKVDSPLYWPVSRKYSSTKKETTREPDAEGWYVFDLSVGGEIKQFKTKDKELASRVDAYEGAFALSLKGNVIQNVYDPTVAKNVKKVAASYRDVMVMDGNDLTLQRMRPLAGDYGKTTEIELYKNTKIYDVSSYAEVKGAKATLSLGDRVTVYTNNDGKAEYIYIHYKNTHEKGHISYCEHCDKEVYWEPYSQTFYETDGHYYAPADMTSWSQKSVGFAELEEGQEQFDIVFDLNGKTVTAKNRFALVYSELTILDTVGGGKIEGLNNSGGLGGLIMATKAGVVNLRSGTLCLAEEPVKLSREGGLIYCGNTSVFNMYGGTIEGGKVAPQEGNEKLPLGGNIVLYSGTTFNMYGGTVKNGDASQGNGGNIAVSGTGKFNMYGGTVEGGNAIYGGAVYLSGSKSSQKATFNMEGGEIKGGSAAPYGGNIYGRHVNMTVAGTISGGSVQAGVAEGKELTANGGNIFLTTGAVVTLTGTVKDPAEGVRYGGNIRLAGGELILQGGTISGGSTYRGGNLYLSGNAKLTVNSGTISGGSAEDRGGNIYNNGADSVMTFNGGTVENGTAKDGGNIYLDNPTTLKLNGGKIVGGTATDKGGNLCVPNKAAIVTVAGGEISGGTATAGGNIYIVGKNAEEQAELTVSGGKITGDANVGNNVKVTMSGEPQITKGTETGIKLAKGVLIDASGLTANASIVVNADGVFTTGSSANAISCFTAADEGATISAKDGELVYNKPAPDYTSNLEFEEGTSVAYCAVCDQKVEWTAITQATHGETAIAAPTVMTTHYYLAEDITYTGTDSFITAGGIYNSVQKTTCLHLNGHNLTASSARVVAGSTGIFNILGTGTVSGNNDKSNNSATIHINCQYGSGIINLYSGKYVKPATNANGTIVHIGENGGTVNLYKDAIIDGTGCSAGSNAVCVNVTGGDPNVNKNRGDGIFNLYGGKIIAGTGTTMKVLTQFASLGVEGGSISGTTDVLNANAVVLSGDITMTKLSVAKGIKLTLGQFGENASIGIAADGVFTQDLTDAQSYLTYFTPAETGATVSVEGSALSYAAPVRGINDDLVFDEGTTNAYCAVCEKKVTWTAITQAEYGETAIAKPANSVVHAHYYLAEDITYTGTATFHSSMDSYKENGVTKLKTSCFHLNGHDLTATSAKVFQGNTGILNVMGDGTVSGNYSATAGTWSGNNSCVVGINVNTTHGEINLYGGTYVKPATNSQPLVNIYNNGGMINLYEGATIDGTDTSGLTVDICNGTFTMKGGKIIGGSSDAIRVNDYSDTAKGTFVMEGGTVEGSVDVHTGTTVTLSGAAKIDALTLAAGQKITLGEMTQEASIKVSAVGVFTEDNESIADYAAIFQPLGQYDKISVKGKALSCDRDYNKALSFAEGTKKAYCPACDKEVEWTEVNQTTNGSTTLRPTAVSTHYYLSGDVNFTGADTFLQAPNTYESGAKQKSACFHLNGYNLTTVARTFAGYTGILNVMGNGTVTGGYVGTSDYQKSTAATVHMNVTAANGTVNLYGGIYTKVEGSPNATLVVHDNGGIINVYEGATVNGGATAYHGNLNVYGAKMTGTLTVAVRTSGKSPVVTVTDAEIENVSVTDGSLTLAGASKLSLAVAEGKKITLGELTQSAAITVTATGGFTEANDKAAEYAAYFTAATEGDSVQVQDNVLTYVTGS